MATLARSCALIGALTLLAALPGTASAQDTGGPQAQAAKSCGISGQQRDLGPTYVLSVSARRVSCRRAKRLVRAYYNCRIDNGGKRGKCGGVSGYSCSETRSGIRSQFDARVTCKKGRKRVKHTYTQNT